MEFSPAGWNDTTTDDDTHKDETHPGRVTRHAEEKGLDSDLGAEPNRTTCYTLWGGHH